MSLLTYHIETDEGHHNHVKLLVRDDPEYDCLEKKLRSCKNQVLEEFFIA